MKKRPYSDVPHIRRYPIRTVSESPPLIYEKLYGKRGYSSNSIVYKKKKESSNDIINIPFQSLVPRLNPDGITSSNTSSTTSRNTSSNTYYSSNINKKKIFKLNMKENILKKNFNQNEKKFQTSSFLSNKYNQDDLKMIKRCEKVNKRLLYDIYKSKIQQNKQKKPYFNKRNNQNYNNKNRIIQKTKNNKRNKKNNQINKEQEEEEEEDFYIKDNRKRRGPKMILPDIIHENEALNYINKYYKNNQKNRVNKVDENDNKLIDLNIDISNNQLNNDNILIRNDIRSPFRSKTKRFNELNHHKNDNLGPGVYELTSPFDTISRNTNNLSPFFKSKSTREFKYEKFGEFTSPIQNTIKIKNPGQLSPVFKLPVYHQIKTDDSYLYVDIDSIT